MARGTLKGGVGTASLRVPGLPAVVVGALAVVNAAGSPADPVTGALLGTAFVPPGLPRPRPPPSTARSACAGRWPHRTRAQRRTPPSSSSPPTPCSTPPGPRRTASGAHAGLARALDPSHTLVDGDTVFALATGEVPLPDGDVRALVALQAAAASAVTLAVLDAVLSATTTPTAAGDVPGYTEIAEITGIAGTGRRDG